MKKRKRQERDHNNTVRKKRKIECPIRYDAIQIRGRLTKNVLRRLEPFVVVIKTVLQGISLNYLNEECCKEHTTIIYAHIPVEYEHIIDDNFCQIPLPITKKDHIVIGSLLFKKRKTPQNRVFYEILLMGILSQKRGIGRNLIRAMRYVISDKNAVLAVHPDVLCDSFYEKCGFFKYETINYKIKDFYLKTLLNDPLHYQIVSQDLLQAMRHEGITVDDDYENLTIRPHQFSSLMIGNVNYPSIFEIVQKYKQEICAYYFMDDQLRGYLNQKIESMFTYMEKKRNPSIYLQALIQEKTKQFHVLMKSSRKNDQEFISSLYLYVQRLIFELKKGNISVPPISPSLIPRKKKKRKWDTVQQQIKRTLHRIESLSDEKQWLDFCKWIVTS